MDNIVHLGTKIDNFIHLGASLTDEVVGGTRKLVPELGRKLDYLFGKATGKRHNIDRSVGLLRQMERIGFPDSPKAREYMNHIFTEILNDPTTFVCIQENGRVLRDFLLVGPNGLLKLESIWEGTKLITFQLLGR
ncbi:MAG: hypothetical protein KAX49_20985 [Halanaerobiales bacterium]|nr:hypothetical protein [Halanaerobiales bacterium]